MEQLALEIAEFDYVFVDDAQRPDAGGGEIQRGGRAKPAGSDNQDACRLEALLARLAHTRQDEVAMIALQLVGRELGEVVGRHSVGEAWDENYTHAPRHSPRVRTVLLVPSPCTA